MPLKVGVSARYRGAHARTVFAGNGFLASRFQGNKDVVQKSFERDVIMMKNLLFAVALLSLALASGCAKGGNGIVPPPPSIAVTPPKGINALAIYPTQSITLTATVSNATTTAVTWAVSGAGCTGSACGTITPVTPVTTPATAVYMAPSTPPGSQVTVTATLVADSTVMGTLGIGVTPVTVVVTPTSVNVGQGLMQQFTAVAVPDDALQTFNWTCSPAGACGSLMCTPANCQGVSGAVVYTAPLSNGSVTVAATSTVGQSSPGVGTSKVAVVTSRLPQGGYSFLFSGNDSNGNHVAVIGNINVDAKGGITGVEDVLPAPPGGNPLTITNGSYTPILDNDISNNLGTLSLNSSNGTTTITNIYTAVLTSSGAIRMIESSDGTGITGSGVMQKSAPQQFGAGAQTFAFGFTGVDSNHKRVGYVGMLTLDGNVTITSGSLDSNDNTNTTNVCGMEPCSVKGSYSQDMNNPGLWHMTLNTGLTQDFDFVIGGGVTQTKTAVNPLTLYAISTDPVDSTHPALSGNMVYQVPMASGYNNAAFSGTSVSSLTGANANVALIVGSTDGTSGGTGGAGGFTGTFDQNNNGVITSVPPVANCVPPTVCSFSSTYVASSGNTGRYTFQMLGNPNANPVAQPLTFVLYASGANRGFLLDQSSAAVMTGSMDPQITPNGFSYTPTELPGTFAAATVGNSDSGVTPVVENLQLTSTGMAAFTVTGTQTTASASQSLMGSYTLNNNSAGGGTGTMLLTFPPSMTAANYVIYAIDASVVTGTANDVITDFFMMGTTSGTPSALIFAQQ